MVLKFVGHGALPGVPARDLNEEDLEALSNGEPSVKKELVKTLIETGLYEEAKAEKPAAQNKMDAGPQENKAGGN